MKLHFLDLQESKLEPSEVVVLPVPYDKTTSYKKGTAKGPEVILKASQQLEPFDHELQKNPYEIGIYTLSPLHITNDKPEHALKKLAHQFQEIVSWNKFPVMLGGEHSLTSAAVSEFKKKFLDLSVLHIDAHADLRDDYYGNKLSHACAIRRVRDELEKVSSLGIRNISEEEYEFYKQSKFHQIQFMPEFDIQKALDNLSENVYITIDLDGLDSSIMPSVGTPEPGGLSWQQLDNLMKETFRQKNVVGADVMELMPIPELHAPDFLAAKLVYKIIGYKFFGK